MFDIRKLQGLREGKQIDSLRKTGLAIDHGYCRETFMVIKYRNIDLARKNIPYDILTNVCDNSINCLLNAGITQILNLLIDDNEDHFDAPQIGVGNSSTAAAPAQTDLQGASQDWHAMEGGFPTVVDQTITFQGQFGDGHAEFNWLECAVRQAGAATTVLNRILGNKGTKVAVEVWSARDLITIT